MPDRDLEGLREYAGEPEELDSWVSYVRLWADSTKVEATRQGPKLLMSLTGKLEQLTDTSDSEGGVGVNRKRLKATRWFAAQPATDEERDAQGNVLKAAVSARPEGPDGDPGRLLDSMTCGIEYLIECVRELVRPNPSLVLFSKYRALVEWRKPPSMGLAECKLSFHRLVRALETDALGGFKFPPTLVALMLLDKANLGQELWHEAVQHMPPGLTGLTEVHVENALERVIGTRKLNDAQRLKAFMRAGRYDRRPGSTATSHQAQTWDDENAEYGEAQRAEGLVEDAYWLSSEEDLPEAGHGSEWCFEVCEEDYGPGDTEYYDEDEHGACRAWFRRPLKGKGKGGKRKGASKGKAGKARFQLHPAPVRRQGGTQRQGSTKGPGKNAAARSTDDYVVVEGVAYPVSGSESSNWAGPWKGKGRGSGLGRCWDCGREGHHRGSRECPGPPPEGGEASKAAQSTTEHTAKCAGLTAVGSHTADVQKGGGTADVPRGGGEKKGQSTSLVGRTTGFRPTPDQKW